MGLRGVTVAHAAEVAPSIILTPAFADVFGTTMAAFEPPAPSGLHTSPWVAVERSSSIQLRCQLAIPADWSLPEMDKLSSLWLLVSLMRLKLRVRVQAAVLANRPFGAMQETVRGSRILAFEDAGWERSSKTVPMTPDDIQ